MISLCIKINDNEVLDFLMNEINKTTISKITCKKHRFKVYENVIVHFQGDDSEAFLDFISTVITNAITLFFEDRLVKDLIDLNYFYFNAPDKKVIFEEYNLLKSNKLKKNPKLYPKNSLTDDIDIVNNSLFFDSIFPCVKNYVRYNKVLLLTGFVNFRLKSYVSSLEDLVSEAVNQYVVDKEYLKFVDMLRGYVSSKIPKNIVLNLIYVNSEGILVTDSGEFVELEDFSSSYFSDISFSKNDYILNTLVGLIPSKIIVHLISPKDQFIKTIELIFEDKVQICAGCELCNAYKLLNLH